MLISLLQNSISVLGSLPTYMQDEYTIVLVIHVLQGDISREGSFGLRIARMIWHWINRDEVDRSASTFGSRVPLRIYKELKTIASVSQFYQRFGL